MFNSKEDVINAVKTFADWHGIPLDQVCLGGGGALMLMGVRESTQDLNLWIDQPYFDALGQQYNVINHPMVDTVVAVNEVPPEGYKIQHAFPVYVRERSRYFKHVLEDGIQIFDPLTLSIHKHGGCVELRRPLEKRLQDRKDIVFLNDILREKNKVKEAA